MVKCKICELNAKYRVRRIFNIVPLNNYFLCERHKKILATAQDSALAIALIACIGLFVFFHSRENRTVEAQAAPERKAVVELQKPDERDLNGDGRVSYYEDQILLGSNEYTNFQAIGYPFQLILVPPQDTPSIAYYLDLKAFLETTIRKDTSSLIPLFHHPQLMEQFLRRFTAENAVPRLEAVILTHGDYLAFALLDPTSQIMTSICLEKLDEELAKEIAKLPKDAERNRQINAQRYTPKHKKPSHK